MERKIEKCLIEYREYANPIAFDLVCAHYRRRIEDPATAQDDRERLQAELDELIAMSEESACEREDLYRFCKDLMQSDALAEAPMEDERDSEAVASGSRSNLTSEELERLIRARLESKRSKSVPELIWYHMRKKGMDPSRLYHSIDLDRKHFSNLVNRQKTYNKRTLMRIALGLQLDYDETVEFLAAASYNFNNSSFDLVVKTCIQGGCLDYHKVNIYLWEYCDESFDDRAFAREKGEDEDHSKAE